MKESDWEQRLKQALSSEAEPEERLNQSLINQLKERNRMKFHYRKKLSVAILGVVMPLVLSITAYASVQLFSSEQVVENLGDQLLAEAFASEDAIQINQSAASGEYHFTLHGVVSGAGLSSLRQSVKDIDLDRTYAVVSIMRQDGRPMPDTADDEYGEESFFISPLIKGQNPLQVNIASMGGGYSETVIDGVQYRLIECDKVELFADKGVYLAISSGSSFYNINAFSYDETTGKVEAREDYAGAAVLFDLPLDLEKADPEKAEVYLETLLDRATKKEFPLEVQERLQWVEPLRQARIKLLNGETIGETIPESVQEVSPDSNGNFLYEYEGWNVSVAVEDFFTEGHVGFSDLRFSVSGGQDDIYKALVFHRDENGVITGRIIILD